MRGRFWRGGRPRFTQPLMLGPRPEPVEARQWPRKEKLADDGWRLLPGDPRQNAHQPKPKQMETRSLDKIRIIRLRFGEMEMLLYY